MITVSMKKRNLHEMAMISEGLTRAADALELTCGLDSRVGYSQKCSICICKQGCRDIARAAAYANRKYFEEVMNK